MDNATTQTTSQKKSRAAKPKPRELALEQEGARRGALERELGCVMPNLSVGNETRYVPFVGISAILQMAPYPRVKESIESQLRFYLSTSPTDSKADRMSFHLLNNMRTQVLCDDHEQLVGVVLYAEHHNPDGRSSTYCQIYRMVWRMDAEMKTIFGTVEDYFTEPAILRAGPAPMSQALVCLTESLIQCEKFRQHQGKLLVKQGVGVHPGETATEILYTLPSGSPITQRSVLVSEGRYHAEVVVNYLRFDDNLELSKVVKRKWVKRENLIAESELVYKYLLGVYRKRFDDEYASLVEPVKARSRKAA